MDAQPVSPLPNVVPDHDGEAGGVAHEEIGDVVRDEDAGLGSIVVGKTSRKHTVEGARPLPEPKKPTDERLATYLRTQLPYHEGCKVCVVGRKPNTHHKRHRS